ncbi:DUF2333 family protein [Dethiosulfatarculus sandiegensis]|uniref:DUF2333 domain-containing protein n=1 Tax=Dethiosulfatarculus sandiegensis TaxID=1429043 RepID=A0A0D2JBI7_9BACT|nr:DUF2333 family protein [Dethiosulfatarculus sandiegensis]KIX15479.1 hypothetical protein X474_04330 [Dethiosulfatarculus sandiegensis]
MTAKAASENNRAPKKKRNYANPFAKDLSLFGRLSRWVVLLVLMYLIISPFVCWYEYQRAFPEYFNPVTQVTEQMKEKGESGDPKKGMVFAQNLISLGEQLLVSWLPNDLLYPTVLMDNPQNFQLGQLEVMRYSVRVLRDKLSRQRTTDKIDKYTDLAFTAFSNDPFKLWLPSAESKFGQGVKSLKKYQQGLEQGTSNFYPRADNLIELLDQLTSLLGGVNTRLANAPRDWTRRLSEETAGDTLSEGEKTQDVKVPWTQLDDNFYMARGVAYSLRQVLMAVRYEFREIIKLKRTGELLDNVIAELALANFEPLMVLNGSRDSVFANHSLKLMATLENVRQKMINIQHMLER